MQRKAMLGIVAAGLGVVAAGCRTPMKGGAMPVEPRQETVFIDTITSGAMPVEPRPVPARQGVTYVVQKGDTLYRLAARFLGDANRWPEIVKANPGFEMASSSHYGTTTPYGVTTNGLETAKSRS